MVGKLWNSVQEKTDQVVNTVHANQRERGRQETYYGFSREITGPHVVRILRVPQKAAHPEHQTCQSNPSPLLALVTGGGPMMSAATRSMGAPAWYLYRHLPHLTEPLLTLQILIYIMSHVDPVLPLQQPVQGLLSSHLPTKCI